MLRPVADLPPEPFFGFPSTGSFPLRATRADIGGHGRSAALGLQASKLRAGADPIAEPRGPRQRRNESELYNVPEGDARTGALGPETPRAPRANRGYLFYSLFRYNSRCDE